MWRRDEQGGVPFKPQETSHRRVAAAAQAQLLKVEDADPTCAVSNFYFFIFLAFFLTLWAV